MIELFGNAHLSNIQEVYQGLKGLRIDWLAESSIAFTLFYFITALNSLF